MIKTQNITPTIHLGGTNAIQLTDAILDARNSIRESIERLRLTAPNGRDYIGRNSDFVAAQDHVKSQIDRLQAIRAELEAQAMAIMDL